MIKSNHIHKVRRGKTILGDIQHHRIQWFSTGAILLSGNTWKDLETFLVVTGREALLASSSGWRPGRQLAVLQCAGQPHQKE